MSTNLNEVYFSMNSAQLSDGEAGGTDIDTMDTRDLGPVITRVSGPGISPHTINFNAATPSVTGAATIEEIAGTTTEESKKEGADLTNVIVIQPSSTTQARLSGPTMAPLAMAHPISSFVPLRGTRAYLEIPGLAAMHQTILTLEDNLDDDDLLDLAKLRTKNKRRRRRQARKFRHLHDEMKRDRQDFADKVHLKDTFNNTTTTSAKDRVKQKSFTNTRFDGRPSLSNLADNLKVESLAQSGWGGFGPNRYSDGKRR